MAKLVFLIFLAFLDYTFIRTVVVGRSLRAKRKLHAYASSLPHRRNAYMFLLLLVLFVLFLEGYVRFIGGSVIGPLFHVHMAFAAPLFVTSFLLVFWMNGEQSRHHRLLAYSNAVFLLGANVTGIPLILLRF